MNKKSGISMMMLIITIVVLVILLSAITLRLNIASCNVLKEELPFNGVITNTQVKSLIDEEYTSNFNEELTQNGDNTTTSFMKIDLSKIGIKKTFSGYEKEGENDIYIYSENTGIVYYLLGVEYDGNVYFSINNDVTNIVK